MAIDKFLFKSALIIVSLLSSSFVISPDSLATLQGFSRFMVP